MMRKLIIVSTTAFGLLLPVANYAANAKGSVDKGNAADVIGYRGVLACVAANAVARDDRMRAGDKEKGLKYETQMRNAFGVAVIEADAQGIGVEEVDQDLKVVQDTLLPRMVRDQAYFYSVVAKCKYLELM